MSVMQPRLQEFDEMADVELVTAILTGPCPCDRCLHAKGPARSNSSSVRPSRTTLWARARKQWNAAKRWPTREQWEILFDVDALKARRERAARKRLASALHRPPMPPKRR